ncbi:hypothetical protein QYF61_003394 [Mycteria americana]|uniref:Uncharacterized protein n=1 Tax=Mycteria americana TaxID=33587 RepID=A0AAN7MQB8_MYCAM|nr:hypothetical protein QYF61_003394 [Mycteria americana]
MADAAPAHATPAVVAVLWAPLLTAVIPHEALVADAQPILAVPIAIAVVRAGELPTVLPGEALLAEAGPIDAAPTVKAVIGADELTAVLTSVALIADTLVVHTAPTVVAVAGAERFTAVFTGEALVAHTLPAHTPPMHRAPLGAELFAAVCACVPLKAHANPIHALALVVTVRWAGGLAAVLASETFIADAFALDAKALVEAVAWAVWFRAVGAFPARLADAAADLDAVIAMSTAIGHYLANDEKSKEILPEHTTAAIAIPSRTKEQELRGEPGKRDRNKMGKGHKKAFPDTQHTEQPLEPYAQDKPVQHSLWTPYIPSQTVMNNTAFIFHIEQAAALPALTPAAESQNRRGWKRPLRSSSPTVNLTLPRPPPDHVPKHLIQTAFKYPQGWRLHHCPGQPVPVLDNPFSEVTFPHIQSKPPLAQLEAISSLVESDEVSPQPPFLQAEQPQVPQPLPISLVLQTLPQLRCPSLDTLQPLNVSLGVRGPTLNTAFEVRPHQCRVQGHDHCPHPAGHTIPDTSQDAIGFLGHLGTLLAHIQAAVDQHPQVLQERY